MKIVLVLRFHLRYLQYMDAQATFKNPWCNPPKPTQEMRDIVNDLVGEGCMKFINAHDPRGYAELLEEDWYV